MGLGSIPKKTKDGRPLGATNRVPDGYSLYITGCADNITSGVRGDGSDLRFSSGTPSVDFQTLDHYYAIGGRVTWEGCTLDNYFNATLIAPASSGAVAETGSYTKYNLAPGMNMFMPTTPGAGDWNIDLNEKKPNTQVLKMTPVPSPGNQGFFDYDSTENTLTLNAGQTGGYNLFDFDISLHAFVRKAWGSSANCSTTSMDVSGLVGKLLFNVWFIRFSFNLKGGDLTTENAAICLTTAAKQNV